MKIENEMPERVTMIWPAILLVPFATPLLGFASIVGYRWTTEAVVAVLVLTFAIAAMFRGIRVPFARSEFAFLIVPLFFFILWSFISIFWSTSVRSAVHHSLLWSCYLSFYILVRQLRSETAKDTVF